MVELGSRVNEHGTSETVGLGKLLTVFRQTSFISLERTSSEKKKEIASVSTLARQSYGTQAFKMSNRFMAEHGSFR
jgi:hypothetical protein